MTDLLACLLCLMVAGCLGIVHGEICSDPKTNLNDFVTPHCMIPTSDDADSLVVDWTNYTVMSNEELARDFCIWDARIRDYCNINSSFNGNSSIVDPTAWYMTSNGDPLEDTWPADSFRERGISERPSLPLSIGLELTKIVGMDIIAGYITISGKVYIHKLNLTGEKSVTTFSHEGVPGYFKDSLQALNAVKNDSSVFCSDAASAFLQPLTPDDFGKVDLSFLDGSTSQLTPIYSTMRVQGTNDKRKILEHVILKETRVKMSLDRGQWPLGVQNSFISIMPRAHSLESSGFSAFCISRPFTSISIGVTDYFTAGALDGYKIRLSSYIIPVGTLPTYRGAADGTQLAYGSMEFPFDFSLHSHYGSFRSPAALFRLQIELSAYYGFSVLAPVFLSGIAILAQFFLGYAKTSLVSAILQLNAALSASIVTTSKVPVSLSSGSTIVEQIAYLNLINVVILIGVTVAMSSMGQTSRAKQLYSMMRRCAFSSVFLYFAVLMPYWGPGGPGFTGDAKSVNRFLTITSLVLYFLGLFLSFGHFALFDYYQARIRNHAITKLSQAISLEHWSQKALVVYSKFKCKHKYSRMERSQITLIVDANGLSGKLIADFNLDGSKLASTNIATKLLMTDWMDHLRKNYLIPFESQQNHTDTYASVCNKKFELCFKVPFKLVLLELYYDITSIFIRNNERDCEDSSDDESHDDEIFPQNSLRYI